MQEVFLQVHKSLAEFRGQAKFSTWLHRVTVNVVLMVRRAARSRPVFAGEAVEDQEPDRGLLPDEDAARRARMEAFRRLLDRLPEKKRTVFVLHEIEGLAPVEIAEIVDAPVLTVRTRLFYARRELAEMMRTEPTLAQLTEELRPARRGPEVSGNGGNVSQTHDEIRALRVMVEELRAEPVPELRWDAIEQRLLSSIAAHPGARPGARSDELTHGRVASGGLHGALRVPSPLVRVVGFAAAAAALALGIGSIAGSGAMPAASAKAHHRVEVASIGMEPGNAHARDLSALRAGDVVEAGDTPVQLRPRRARDLDADVRVRGARDLHGRRRVRASGTRSRSSAARSAPRSRRAIPRRAWSRPSPSRWEGRAWRCTGRLSR